MNTTSHTLLERVRNGDGAAGDRFAAVYYSFIQLQCRHLRIPHADAEEITQDAMRRILGALPEFHHSGRTGAFRNFVKTIVKNLFLDHVQKEARRSGRSVGGSDFRDRLNQEPDPVDELERAWDREHDRHVVRHLLERLKSDGPFQAASIEACLLQVIDGLGADAVAERLGISKTAAYVARSKVLTWLRHELAGMIDDRHFA